MSRPTLLVIGVDTATADDRAVTITFAELWPEHIVIHSLVQRDANLRLRGDESRELMHWTAADNLGNAYTSTRAGCRMRNEVWSLEVVLAPALALGVHRLTVTIPDVGAEAVFEVTAAP